MNKCHTNSSQSAILLLPPLRQCVCVRVCARACVCVRVVVTDESSELEDIKLMNDPNESDVDNLINLPHLHEPAILHCLERRYHQSDIYTYTGPSE